MKPKMKKNPAYRHHGGHADDDSSGLGFDKKSMHRKERRVFTSRKITNYYKEIVEPALKEEEKENEAYEYAERGPIEPE